MKRFYIAIMVAALLTACGHRASKGSTEHAQDSLHTEMLETPESSELHTDSIGLVREDTMAVIKVSADWPVSGQQALVSSIRQYICEELAYSPNQEGEPEVKLYEDGRTAIETTLQKNYQELVAQKKEALDNGVGYGWILSYYRHISKLEDNDRYVTYLTNGEGFLGGAHGYATSTGVTFRKCDGKRIGYTTKFNTQKGIYEIFDQTLFKNPRSKALNNILKECLRSYYQEFLDRPVTDEELIIQLISLNSLENIPLPNNPPIFTKDGLCFTYQQYEIAPYAMGMITFNIAYDKIRPFLTKEAAEILK